MTQETPEGPTYRTCPACEDEFPVRTSGEKRVYIVHLERELEDNDSPNIPTY